VGAVAGFALGLVAWLAYRPHLQASAHHVIGVLQLPWTVIWISMILAVLASYAAAARPARVIARIPVVTALSGRPPAPKPVRHLAVPFGLGFLVLAFFLLGLAGAGVGTSGSGASTAQLHEVGLGFIALVIALVLLSPAFLAVLARLGRWTPVTVRLALRDLARYRARSGPALAAISLSVLIASIVLVVGTARFGDALDWVGPNLTSSQLIVYPPGHDNPNGPPPTASQLTTAGTAAQGIAAALDDRYTITLETPSASLQYGGTGRGFSGTTYVATPQLLNAFGITPSQVSPDADFLTMRPGLSTTQHLQLWDTRKVLPHTPCTPGSCLASPPIQETGALPSGTSAPNTVITEHAMRTFGFAATTAGWLIQAPGGLTATQITNARQTAATAGASIETINNIPSSAQVTDVAIIFAMVLALGVLAMSIGLVRSETASDLRTLTAAGASGAARRTLTAATAGALALTGAVAGTAAGYLAATSFFRTSQLDQLSELGSVPVAGLLWILVGLPAIAIVVSWLLAGREPDAIARQPLE
jgi:putative ABC transport system permease protein